MGKRKPEREERDADGYPICPICQMSYGDGPCDHVAATIGIEAISLEGCDCDVEELIGKALYELTDELTDELSEFQQEQFLASANLPARLTTLLELQLAEDHSAISEYASALAVDSPLICESIESDVFDTGPWAASFAEDVQKSGKWFAKEIAKDAKALASPALRRLLKKVLRDHPDE